MLFFGGPWDGEEFEVPKPDPNSIASYVIGPERDSYTVIKLGTVFSTRHSDGSSPPIVCDLPRARKYWPVMLRVGAYDEVVKYHIVNRWCDEGVPLICFLTGRKVVNP